MALFDLPKRTNSVNNTIPKVSETKSVESVVKATENKTKPTPPIKSVNPATTKPKETNTPKKNTPKIDTSSGWYYDNKRVPEEGRPIEVYTDKKICTAYKVSGGYITDDAYFINTYRNANGHIMYRYIVGCLNTNNCPNHYPQCRFCNKKKG